MRVVRLAAAGAALLLLLPAATATATGHSQPVPILMYHVIQPPTPGAPYPGLFVPEEQFAAQMHALARAGFHAVTLGRVYRHWREGTPLPPHPIVITFDDGYRSVYLNAFPVLRSLHWPGVLNLLVKNDGYSWGLRPWVVRLLLKAGWELDSHTISHRDLTTLAPADLKREVAGSRHIFRQRFHVPVDFFCYPAGRYDATVIAAVQAAGYLAATSTRYGLARPSELWTLARIRVNGGESTTTLLSDLHGLGA